ncbi:hypothetical protein [Senegalimassilia anaerobia]|uniref:hypothetical protein n=1 Tax=Senegalimassilia anaerobia TaxID=1473216 RepID=UPI00267320B4|nr:hypothetical protein [Senegalimassilia anaerobia]
MKVPVEGFGAVCCSSPELTFLQIAVKHTLLETVYMGYALCSSYRIDADAENGIALREGDDEPLTSVARIGQYLAKVDGTYGSAKARRALAHVRDGSISPTESAMAMALSMPRRFGGFAAGDVVLGENVAGRGCLSVAEGSGTSGRMLTVRSTNRRRDVAALNISLPDGIGGRRTNGPACGIDGPEDPEEFPVAAFCARHGGTTFDRGSEAADAEGDQRAKSAIGAATAGAKDARDARKTDREVAASRNEHGGLQRRAILVRPEQVHEFDAYVQLCEKVARRMRRRSVPRGGFAGHRELQEARSCEATGVYEEVGGLPAFEDKAEAKQRAKEARQLAKRVELWQTLVCFSAFRQSETGSSVNVFDPPPDRVCARRGEGEDLPRE